MSLRDGLGLFVLVAAFVWIGLRFPNWTPTRTPAPEELKRMARIPGRPDQDASEEQGEESPGKG